MIKLLDKLKGCCYASKPSGMGTLVLAIFFLFLVNLAFAEITKKNEINPALQKQIKELVIGIKQGRVSFDDFDDTIQKVAIQKGWLQVRDNGFRLWKISSDKELTEFAKTVLSEKKAFDKALLKRILLVLLLLFVLFIFTGFSRMKIGFIRLALLFVILAYLGWSVWQYLLPQPTYIIAKSVYTWVIYWLVLAYGFLVIIPGIQEEDKQQKEFFRWRAAFSSYKGHDMYYMLPLMFILLWSAAVLFLQLLSLSIAPWSYGINLLCILIVITICVTSILLTLYFIRNKIYRWNEERIEQAKVKNTQIEGPREHGLRLLCFYSVRVNRGDKWIPLKNARIVPGHTEQIKLSAVNTGEEACKDVLLQLKSGKHVINESAECEIYIVKTLMDDEKNVRYWNSRPEQRKKIICNCGDILNVSLDPDFAIDAVYTITWANDTFNPFWEIIELVPDGATLAFIPPHVRHLRHLGSGPVIPPLFLGNNDADKGTAESAMARFFAARLKSSSDSQPQDDSILPHIIDDENL